MDLTEGVFLAKISKKVLENQNQNKKQKAYNRYLYYIRHRIEFWL